MQSNISQIELTSKTHGPVAHMPKYNYCRRCWTAWTLEIFHLMFDEQGYRLYGRTGTKEEGGGLDQLLSYIEQSLVVPPKDALAQIHLIGGMSKGDIPHLPDNVRCSP